MASFWETLGPGLLQTGGNILLNKMGGRQAQDYERRLQGPLYDTRQQMASESLALARGMDPKAAAAERFAAQQKLLAPGNEAQMNDLMQMLQSKGLLGLASHSAVPGTAMTPGVAVNPYVASLLAAQQGAKEKSAFDSLREGEQQLDRLVNRGTTLQPETVARPPTPSAGQAALRGGLKILQDPRARSTIWDTLKKVPGLLGFDRPYFGNTDDNFYA